MKRLLFVLAVAALALPAAALAKGPSEATLTGPGIKAVKITGGENEGSPLMNLAQAAGFFPAAFGQEPNVMLSGRPKGDLGPKYSLDYKVPWEDGKSFQIHQDVYAYAKPYAVTYTPPGQPIFDTATRGGWFTDSTLKERLGVPATPAAVSTSSSGFSAGFLGPVAALLLLCGAAWLVWRKRTRPSAA
jgi:hypothetical protein